MRERLSTLMPASLALAVAVLGFFRAQKAPAVPGGGTVDAELLLIAFYVLWLVREAGVTPREEGRDSDRGTRELYALGQVLTIVSALLFGPREAVPGPLQAAGCALFAAGITLRTWAIETLGAHYSHRVREIEGHRIVDAGPYACLRHPAYTGMLAAHGGIILFFCNKVTLVLFLLVMVPAVVRRIFIEEKMLMGIPGYGDFAAKRKRLVPFLW